MANSVEYRLIIKGPGFGELERSVKKDVDVITIGLIEVGEKIKDRLRSEIKQGTKRKGATGVLANSINSSFINQAESKFVGVGNVLEMFAKAPYWFVVNYGAHFPGSYEEAIQGVTGSRFIPVANYGSFEGKPPRPGTPETDKWVHTGKKEDFLLKPKKFRPINYIEKTNNWLEAFWPRYWLNKIK